MSDSFDELATLLKKASSTLSEQTGYVSVALTPRLRKSYLKQLKMMMIEPGKVLVVVVLSAGIVKDRLVRIPDYMTPEQLSLVCASIESGLSGKPLDEITLVTVVSAAKDSRIPDPLLNQILYEAYTAIKQADNLQLYMEGTNRMLSLPEFSNISRARNLFDTLAMDGIVSGYVNEMSPEDDKSTYMIRIGQEISIEGLTDCSFVTTTYNVGDKIAGNIGVIGPKRMEYSKVVSQIAFVRQVINNQIEKIKTLNGG